MKTVNLELSQKLKDAGYPQEDSENYYMLPFEDKYAKDEWDMPTYGLKPVGFGYYLGMLGHIGSINCKESFASPTTDEILEQLPAQIQDGELYGLEIQKSPNFYLAQYYDNYGKHSLVSRSAKELSDLLAIMWLYLKENNLLEVKG